MVPNSYQALAMEFEADQNELFEHVKSMGVKGTRLNNAVRGLADDCGELNGAVKNWLEYRQPLDVTNVKEEVGDCLWRLAQVCHAVGITLEEAMEANIRKLREVRYKRTGRCNPEDAANQNRDREAERRAIDDGVVYEEHNKKTVDAVLSIQQASRLVGGPLDNYISLLSFVLPFKIGNVIQVLLKETNQFYKYKIEAGSVAYAVQSSQQQSYQGLIQLSYVDDQKI